MGVRAKKIVSVSVSVWWPARGEFLTQDMLLKLKRQAELFRFRIKTRV
jgi:hypothetical protein